MDLASPSMRVSSLRSASGFRQRPGSGGGEEFVVGHRVPEEVREPSGEFPVIDLGPLSLGSAFFEVIEVLRGEDADQPA